MPFDFTRRQFARTTAAASLAALAPQGIFRAATAPKKAVVHADQEIGLVRPEFHSNFAEHLGSCVYGGMWVGKKSPIPNINGFRKATVDYLKALGVPVLRWPGGCFADDYHWRDGIGPAAKRPKRVNIHWGNYTEDNGFGTHEFVEFCRLIGAEPYFAANVGSGRPQEMRDWMEYCNYPKGSTLSDERAANGSPEPFNVRYWGVGNELWGCGGNMHPDQAAREYRRFATYARNFGSTPLFLVGCGPSGNDLRWTRGFMDNPRQHAHARLLHALLRERLHAGDPVHARSDEHAAQPFPARGGIAHSAAHPARYLRPAAPHRPDSGRVGRVGPDVPGRTAEERPPLAAGQPSAAPSPPGSGSTSSTARRTSSTCATSRRW